MSGHEPTYPFRVFTGRGPPAPRAAPLSWVRSIMLSSGFALNRSIPLPARGTITVLLAICVVLSVEFSRHFGVHLGKNNYLITGKITVVNHRNINGAPWSFIEISTDQYKLPVAIHGDIHGDIQAHWANAASKIKITLSENTLNLGKRYKVRFNSKSLQ